MRAFDFGQQFQDRVLYLLLTSTTFARAVCPRITSECFTSELSQSVAAAAIDFYTRYSEPPKDLLLNELSGFAPEDVLPAVEQYVRRLLKMGRVNEEYVLDRVGAFVKQAKIADAIIEARDLLIEERFDEAEQVVTTAFREGQLQSDFGYDWGEKAKERTRERRRRKPEENFIFTFIPEMDRRMGGLRRGELGVLFGPPSRGKTMGMVHLMKAALFQGMNVVYYTLEMSAELISERLDMAVTGLNKERLQRGGRLVREKAEVLRGLGSRALVCWYPTGSVTALDLRRHLFSLGAGEFLPDMVIVDYGDLLERITPREAYRLELSDTFKALRRIAGEFKVPVWTGSQSNKESLSRVTITMGDVAECFEKAGIADVMISLCQTEEEEEMGEMRLFVAKNRSGGPKGWVVSVKQDFSRMQFCLREEEED